VAPDVVRLLEIEPRLGAALPRDELASARRHAVAPLGTLAAGEWSAHELRRLLADRQAFACLVADGLITHDLQLDGRIATDLLGPGDAIAPPVGGSRSLPLTEAFGLAEPASLAVLDETFAAVCRTWPSIATALVLQLQRQTDRLAVRQAISQLPQADQRIVALLWHLAGRWGRAEPQGVVVPLTLDHALIGRLVGGRRPTISAALGRLADRALVIRLANGTWLLTPESRTLLGRPHGTLQTHASARLLGARRRPGTS
jgi:hypothetical protein